VAGTVKASGMGARPGWLALGALSLAAASGGGTSRARPAPPPTPVPSAASIVLSTAGDPNVEWIAPLLRGCLAADRRSFAGQTGRVEGFSAGEAYPQVWLRDSATLLPFARYLYPRPVLVSWLEEHLSHQRPSGELSDWIAPGGPDLFRPGAPRCRQIYRLGATELTADRNTAAADQESSAVHAAYLYVRLSGDDAWLRRRVLGRSVLDRLDAGLRFLLRVRLDRRLHLVTSALTADWGDVSPAYPDQRAIYLDEKTPVVAALYPSVTACRASREMSWLHARGGDPGAAQAWATRAEDLRRAMRRRLWQPERGFFRMHLSTDGRPLPFDDSGLFALGGNALAISSGVATPEEAARIFAVVEERRRAQGLDTVASVLLPPYPRGFFLHPALREEYGYQNGGQWDWWAGPYVRAEFEQGHARGALAHLTRILDRVRRAGGLFEWSTRNGRGRGSPMYAGSAAALGTALVEGTFGIDLRDDRLEIRTRACEAASAVELREPATHRRVAYRCGPAAGGVSLRYETERVPPGRLCVLLPPGRGLRGAARLDGRIVPVVTEAPGEDQYGCVDTEWGRGELSLLLAPLAPARKHPGRASPRPPPGGGPAPATPPPAF
jgi:hypothetical protein